MKDWQSQAHVRWDCKYHVVILPKYRKKRNFKSNRRKIGVPFGSTVRLSVLLAHCSGEVFGREATVSVLSALMKRRFVSTFRNKKNMKKTN